MASRLRKGDNVAVISGKDKGKQGVVLQVYPSLDKVTVEGVNIQNVRESHGAVARRVEAPIYACKVMLVDPATGKPTRVRSFTADGVKSRAAVRSGAVIAAIGK